MYAYRLGSYSVSFRYNAFLAVFIDLVISNTFRNEFW